jgi:hypothetical protein
VRPSKVWSAVKHVKFETSLLTVPRRHRSALRTYVAGKRTR